jgi:hypothetical protein
MKKRNLFLVLFVAALAMINVSCEKDKNEGEFVVLLVASERPVVPGGEHFMDGHPKYWIQREGDTKWGYLYNYIVNFDYEEGYEYFIEVCITKLENPPVDVLPSRYTLVEIISKEKKDSDVPTPPYLEEPD